MSKTEKQPHRKATIGTSSNFWLHSSRTSTFDLTHPSTPASESTSPRLDLHTTTTPITVDPAKTALIIIDMQNFFLSPSLGRSTTGAGHSALHALQHTAIPAARKAGIRTIWVNWGLTDSDMETMPPAITRAFGIEAVPDDPSSETNRTVEDEELFAAKSDTDDGVPKGKIGAPREQNGDDTKKLLENGKPARIYRGLGTSLGPITLPSGETIEGGKLLYRDTWNAALQPPLDSLYTSGSQLPQSPDVWIHKNRMSGLWGATTPLQDFLEKEGIRTLLFTGVNTDQCVSGTLTDAFSKGYDCVLLEDGCGTTSPEFARDGILFNAAKTWGFVAGCADLERGVQEMVGAGR